MDATLYRMTNKSERTYSVIEAAKKVGVHRTTLIRWLNDEEASKVVKASKTVQMPKSGHIYRAFTDEDIEKIKQFHKDHYWEIDYTARIRYKRKPR